jgi:23S rRNA pseudouridine1911/1915/1917 synthase
VPAAAVRKLRINESLWGVIMFPEVLFADNHVLAVDKPPGMLTQATAKCRESVEAWGREWIRREKSKPGNVFLHSVHRLDRPVGGVVLLARTSKALSRLNAAMRSRKIRKTYLTIVSPPPSVGRATLQHRIRHSGRHAVIVGGNEEQAKMASLSFVVKAANSTFALLEVVIETGRYHQIRAQLAHAGMPIVGDRKYGGRPLPSALAVDGGTIALHHTKVTFPHPVGGHLVTVTSSPPAIWTRMLTAGC